MPQTTDVAIIGGGVMGCTIAYYLAKQGIKSAVFEQNRFGFGATGASGGMITPLWHVDHTNPPLFDMGMKSLETFPALTQELNEAGIDPDFRQSGIIKVAMTPQEAEILKNDLIWQGELGIGVRWLETDEVLEVVPEVNPNILGGVYSPTEGHVNAQRLVDSLVHAASQMGVAFHEGVEVTSLETDGNRVTGVRTRQDTYHAKHTVLAAGAWTGLARRWLPGPTLPVRPVKGQRLILRKPGFLPKVMVHSFMGSTLPKSDGTLIAAATRHEGEFDQEITVDAITTILSNATTILPILKDAMFLGAKAGVRPGSPDDVPIIGPVRGWEGLIVASGHDGTGIMLSPGTGQLVTDYIATGDERPLEAFSLSRFGN